MWYPAEIVLKSYLPLELEEGMLFINRISVGIMEPYIELWELEEIPDDIDAFMSINGAPVELFVICDDEILATHDEIGWWDEGEDTDELRDISLEDINFILRDCEGYVDIDIEEDTDDLIPVMYEDKIVLGFNIEPDDNDDWDITLMDGLEE
jgi:hypothetical protein